MQRTIAGVVSTFLILLLAAQASAAPRAFKAEASGWLDTQGHYLILTDGKGTHLGKLQLLDAYYEDSLLDGHTLFLPGLIALYPTTGDLIYLQMTHLIDLDPVTGIGIGTLSFVGGTGRFENASGTVDMMFRLILDNSGMSFELVMDGSIDY